MTFCSYDARCVNIPAGSDEECATAAVVIDRVPQDGALALSSVRCIAFLSVSTLELGAPVYANARSMLRDISLVLSGETLAARPSGAVCVGCDLMAVP